MARLAIGAEEKKKLYVLGGLLAAIVIVVVVLYVPRGNKSGAGTGSESAGNTTTASTPQPPDAATPPAGQPNTGVPAQPGTGEASAPAAPEGGGGGINAASLMSVSTFRNDPFEPVPLPPPVVVAAPPGPIELTPPSVLINSPGGALGGSLPPFGISSPSTQFGGTAPARILANLHPPRIPHVIVTPTAPKIVTMSGDGGVTRSPNKRLSGVVIGDSVHAILEISQGDNTGGGAGMGAGAATTTITRIVQPGDEVDGIRILRVERTSEGGKPVTRMYIIENGEESYVDLRPAPQANTAGGVQGGAGGGMRPPF